MNEQEDDVPTLSYAHTAEASQHNVRPIALIVPNLLAIVVMFLPVASQAPITPFVHYVANITHKSNRPMIWEAFITSPFLLAIPLALWTIRLSIRPRAGRIELISIWGMTATSLIMTLLACGYCVAHVRSGRFMGALVGTMLVLAAGAWGVWSVRGLLKVYPPALLAMTTAWAANSTLTSLVVLSHSQVRIGIVAGIAVVMLQIIAASFLVSRWKAFAPAL